MYGTAALEGCFATPIPCYFWSRRILVRPKSALGRASGRRHDAVGECLAAVRSFNLANVSGVENKTVPIRSWRASLIRKKGQVLGDVEAPSREAAEAEAVRTFNLSPGQRSRLMVQERG